MIVSLQRLREREGWLTAGMFETLQLDRASCQWAVHQWQTEIVARTAFQVDEWSYSHAQWLEAMQQ